LISRLKNPKNSAFEAPGYTARLKNHGISTQNRNAPLMAAFTFRFPPADA
jgi:hypothetical protein